MKLTERIKGYFSIKGRANRSEFLIYVLISLLALITIFVFEFKMSSGEKNRGVDKLLKLFMSKTSSIDLLSYGFKYYQLTTFTFIIWVIGNITIRIKRLHDLGRPAWFLGIYFVPYIGSLIMETYLSYFKGSPGSNQYNEAIPTSNKEDIPFEIYDEKKNFLIKRVFERNLEKGVSKRRITEALLKKGYSLSEIEQVAKLYK